jgi:2-phosphoglycerate kinase
MSSKAGKIKSEIVHRRIETVVQVLAIMEEEAHKKSFSERFAICWQYLFHKRFDAFFKEGKHGKKVQDS